MAQGNPSPQEPAQVVVLAPIDDSVIVRPSSPASAYILKVTSSLPGGCAEFNGFNVERVGDNFRVEVTNLMPRPSLILACTSIYGYNKSEIWLGSGLIVGETYTVTISEGITILFTAQDDVALAMVESLQRIQDELHAVVHIRGLGHELRRIFLQLAFLEVALRAPKVELRVHHQGDFDERRRLHLFGQSLEL